MSNASVPELTLSTPLWVLDTQDMRWRKVCIGVKVGKTFGNAFCIFKRDKHGRPARELYQSAAFIGQISDVLSQAMEEMGWDGDIDTPIFLNTPRGLGDNGKRSPAISARLERDVWQKVLGASAHDLCRFQNLLTAAYEKSVAQKSPFHET